MELIKVFIFFVFRMKFCEAICNEESIHMKLFEIFRLHFVSLKMTVLQIECKVFKHISHIRF
jgi:hypothetical protein